MSDDQEHTGDTTLLASIYLDGEATVDERALVETSTEALDEVRELSDVRTVLAATFPTASLSAREGHLAVALDVWARMTDLERAGEVTPSDGIAAAAAAAVTTPESSSRRVRTSRRDRFTSGRWLAGAAAALLLVVGAGIVLNAVASDDQTESPEVAIPAAPSEPVTELGELEAAEAAEVNGENVGADVVPNSDLSDEAAGPAVVPDEADEADGAADGATPADQAEADEAATEESTDTTLPGAEQPAPPPESATLEVDSADELAIYASLALPALAASSSVNDQIEFDPAFGPCEEELGIDEELEPVIYQGTEVVVGVDVDSSLVLAYTIAECDVVESAALPAESPRDAATP